MTYYQQEERWGTYHAFDDMDDNTHTYLKVEEIYRNLSCSNVISVAERSLPVSSEKELCVVKETGSFARGVFTKSSGVAIDLEEYLRQLSLVDHKNLIKFYGYGKSNHDNVRKLVLICDYCPGGDLEEYLTRTGESVSCTQALAYIKQVLDGLCYLHGLRTMADDAKNIIHCDIKPRNLFLCDYRQGVGYMTIKIGDHDDPVHMSSTITHANDVRDLRGTKFYMSPEMCLLQRNARVGRKTDTWSVGCVLLKMGLGKKELQFAFGDDVKSESSFETLEEYRHFMAVGASPVIRNDLDVELSDVVSACLVHDQNDRPFAHELAALFGKKLQSALTAYLGLSKSCDVEIRPGWRSKFNADNLQIPKHYWTFGYIELRSDRVAFENEWLYIVQKFQKLSFDGPVSVLCGKNTLESAKHLKNYIITLSLQRASPYSLSKYTLFADNVFPNLVSITVNEACTIEKLESIFIAAPRLAEVCLNGTRLVWWDEATTKMVPTTLRYLEWRLPRGAEPQSLETLYEMDQHEKFCLLRTFLQNNPSLTSNKVAAEIFTIGGITSSLRPLHYPRFLSTNFLCLLGRSFIFQKNGRELSASMTRALPENCGCPLKHASCVLTACMNNSSHYAVTVTGDMSAEDWLAFWNDVRKRHSEIGFPKPCAVVKLSGISLNHPLDFRSLWVVVLTIEGYSSVTSKQLTKWRFNDLLQIKFRNCKKVSMYTGNMSDSFPALQSIVMDNSALSCIEENVFSDFRSLSHLCLDGEKFFHAIQRSTMDKTPLDPDVYNHLKKIHFDLSYFWLRGFINRNQYLVESRLSGALYNIADDLQSPSYSMLHNFIRLDGDIFKAEKLLRLKPNDTF